MTIREENATAALEVMSRFAANPKWLIYLPPTMSPCETSEQDGFLEHPPRPLLTSRQGVPQVVCEEKHMGSRAVVIVCRDEETASRAIRRHRRNRDRLHPHRPSILQRRRIWRRSSSPGFARHGVSAAFGTQFNTTWACLDCELMPWSAKAQELLRSQYAAVGAAGSAACRKAVDASGAGR